ncbi:cyclodeaminase/cyclohydrolase family protein [Cellvibrio japonicus]|uniref:Conserved domain protein n=1 Tax=Cellvibrio japonicus (strain Ueda107) TaxID=498211 RepID=B3PFV3_CELJU|nr:cyclodeaminase/cyclohydrolase family protein [Cellvibrio japonicus]ACE86334.1 conserved domain protein [Cellvibrio japonicus Ueda107]QEI12318.1 cyclodeaminase/cyclohydrolase family protein [Cellvibrio japonicus]QEI15891.1 cyclodeaminase/cyclohydrolase family protein [Cellvibrio japonicus]QEI19470.1 cyclodeaminase/cyclohydrolase family protein [Cellvibrio japonicus]
MVDNQQTLMALPANQLLDKFGAGSHKPGSGSAAALMGILAGKLIITVGKLSLDRPKYAKDHSKIQYIIERIENDIEPELLKLFDHDAEIFDEVIKLRVARDKATTEKEKRKLSDQANEKLREATEIPIRICEYCIRLIDHGVAMFDMGFEAARGDSGAGVSAAVAGAMSSVFVINLNLKSFRDSEWAKSRRKRVNELQKMLEEKQFQAFGRVSQLKEEDVESMTLNL